jgi:hypothetical protein
MSGSVKDADHPSEAKEVRELTPLELARARSAALREEMDKEPFVHIPAEEDYRSHQRTDEKQWSKAAMIREAEAERHARHSELIHSTSEQDERIDDLMARSQLHQFHGEKYGEVREEYDSEKHIADSLEKTRERMKEKLVAVANRKTSSVPKITESAAEYRKRLCAEAGYLPGPSTSTAGDQVTTTSHASSKLSVAPPSSSHSIHQTSAKEYVDFMRATLDFDAQARHTADNQVGLGGEESPAINYGGLRTASEREKAEHDERNTYAEARERMEHLRRELKNEERYDERHGGY